MTSPDHPMRAAVRELRTALRNVDLEPEDERLIAWLARWEPEVVARFASMIERARRAEEA